MVEQTADGSDQPVGSGKTPGWSFMLWWVLASVVGGVVGLVIYGGITGFVMVRLLRQGAAGDDAVAASA